MTGVYVCLTAKYNIICLGAFTPRLRGRFRWAARDRRSRTTGTPAKPRCNSRRREVPKPRNPNRPRLMSPWPAASERGGSAPGARGSQWTIHRLPWEPDVPFWNFKLVRSSGVGWNRKRPGGLAALRLSRLFSTQVGERSVRPRPSRAPLRDRPSLPPGGPLPRSGASRPPEVRCARVRADARTAPPPARNPAPFD